MPDNRGVNEALRRAGFVRIPAWWVKQDELQSILPALHRMAHNHAAEVTAIRLKHRKGQEDDTTAP